MQQLHFSPISLYNWLRRITLRLGRCHRQITFSLPIQPFLSTYCGLLAWFSHCLALLLLPWYNNGLVIISRLLSVDLHPTPRVCNSGFCIIASLIFFQTALIRSFLFEGVESFKMATIVEGIPTVLHVAVVLFILGLIQFLFSVNLIVASAVLGIFLLLVSLYFGMTILPIVWAECPYRTPFSVLVRYAVIWPMNLIYKILHKIYMATSDGSLLKKVVTGGTAQVGCDYS